MPDNRAHTQDIQRILGDLAATRPAREALYTQFHRHPELSMQEHATAERIIHELSLIDAATVTPISPGTTGIVATLRNGDGPTVAMRADYDGLPVKEDSDKDYASTATQVNRVGEEVPVAHACGHDVHITALLGAVQALAAHPEAWSGTFHAVFQPGEETGEGARAMVDGGVDKLLDPRPDVYLGQHVLGTIPGGCVGTIAGPVFSTAESMTVTIFGRGGHGSMPQLAVDPVVVASSAVMKLQTLVSRSLAPHDFGVVTVGSIQAGSAPNIIPDTATLMINVRAFSPEVRDTLHQGIVRIITAECEGAACPTPPEFEFYSQFPITDNDAAATATVRAAFDQYFGDKSVDMARQSASEDFSIIPDSLGCPYVYWGLGGFADAAAAPGNHHPGFAPDMRPTLDRGVEAIVVAACAWLGRS